MKNKKIWTIPNFITFFRLLLIPAIIWAYCVEKDYVCAAIVVVVSGVTDVVDGIIARKFNMVSDLGKALDPVADKLTQIAVMICLVSRFPIILMPLSIIVIKELVTGIMSLASIKKSGNVMGAVWHGKVNTVLLYAVMTVHMLWADIPQCLSYVLVLVSSAMMIFSAVMYFVRNMKVLRKDI